MPSWIEVIALAAMASVFPAASHLGSLRVASLRPPFKTQLSKAERLLFRYLPILFLLNGGLVGAGVFLAKTGSYASALAIGFVALPSLGAQLTALVIAKARDVAGAGTRRGNVR